MAQMNLLHKKIKEEDKTGVHKKTKEEHAAQEEQRRRRNRTKCDRLLLNEAIDVGPCFLTLQNRLFKCDHLQQK